MRKLQRSLLASAITVGFAASGTAAAQYSNIYFFGDSLIDSGNYKSLLPPGTGLFTTNPGPVMSQVLAERFGFSAIPSTAGGNNYAYGGARVTLLPGVVSPPLSPAAAVPVATQVQQYLAKGAADPKALYSVEGGANDFFFQANLLLTGQATPAQVQAALGTAAVDLAKQAALLKAAGARNIIVWSAPDLGTTPAGAASGIGPSLTALSTFFNQTLFGTLDALGVQGIRPNTGALQNEILKNPAAFGLQNVTGSACTTPSTVTIALCNASTLISPNAPNTYFWANSSGHPTTAGHQIFGDYAISFIDGPMQMAALAEAPLAVEQANFRALDNRMWSSLNAPRTQGKLEAWAAYDYGHADLQTGPSGGSAHMNTVAVGGDMKVSDRMLVGAMFGYTDTKGDFGGPGGGYTLRQPVGTVYAGYGDGPWYVGATLGAGSLDYSDINRIVPLGTALRNESAEARGYEFTGRILGGYWFTMKELMHGPYARLAWTKAVVKQFSETGSDSTALIYGEQSRNQLLWSLGWQVAGNIGAIRPYARATWELDSKDQSRSVGASSVGLGGNYTIPVGKPDNSYALFNLGASTEFGSITGFVAGSATAGRTDGNSWALTVGMRMPL